MHQIPLQSRSSALATAVLLACLTYCRGQSLPPVVPFAPSFYSFAVLPTSNTVQVGPQPLPVDQVQCIACVRHGCALTGRLAEPQHHRGNLHHTECCHCRVYNGSKHHSVKSPYASVRWLQRVQGQPSICQVGHSFLPEICGARACSRHAQAFLGCSNYFYRVVATASGTTYTSQGFQPVSTAPGAQPHAHKCRLPA